MNVSGRVNQHISVRGNHSVYIRNDTNSVQWFKYSYELIIDGYTAGSYSRNIDLKPGGTFNASDTTVGDLNKSSPGSYRMSASTKIEGSSASASDTSYVTGALSK